jgi:hypothetical protein
VQTELVGGEADALGRAPMDPQRIEVERDGVSVLAHAQIEKRFVTSTSTVNKRRGPTSSGRIPSTPSTRER